MGHRFPAITSLLAIVMVSAGGGCAVNSGKRSVAVSQSPQSTTPQTAHLDMAKPQSMGGILTEAEAPHIASATKFADAQSAAESRQAQSMREQMARRYGCCGR